MREKQNTSRNVTMAKHGLLEESVWKYKLRGYPISLVCSIRERLLKKIPDITEKFNKNSRYFGYWVGEEKDRAYIYVQKKNLRIDLCISRAFEPDIRKDGFEIRYSHNFQGRADWLTGWQVPHSSNKVETIVKWLCKAFEGD